MLQVLDQILERNITNHDNREADSILHGRFQKTSKNHLSHSVICGDNGGIYAVLNSLTDEEMKIFMEEGRIAEENLKSWTKGKENGKNKLIIGEGGLGKIRLGIVLVGSKNSSTMRVGEIICFKKTKNIIEVGQNNMAYIRRHCYNDYFSGEFKEIILSPNIYDIKIMDMAENIIETKHIKGYTMMQLMPIKNGAASFRKKGPYHMNWEHQKCYFKDIFERIQKLLNMGICMTDLKLANTLYNSESRRGILIDLGGVVKKPNISKLQGCKCKYVTEYTEKFTAPEILEAVTKKDYGAEIDLCKAVTYSLGLMCEESGVSSKEFEVLIKQMKEINPKERISLEKASLELDKINLVDQNTGSIEDFMQKLKEKTQKDPTNFGLNPNIIQITNVFIDLDGADLDPVRSTSLCSNSLELSKIETSLNDFLQNNELNVFVLLGSSGSGKSTLLQKKYLEKLKSWKYNDPIPLYMNLASEEDLKKRLDWLTTQIGIKNLDFNIFSGHSQTPLILFLDSFDEIGLKENYVNFVEKIFDELGKNFLTKCIICCRSEIIQDEDKDIRRWFFPARESSQKVTKKYISPLNEKFDYKAYFDKFYDITKDPHNLYFSIFEKKRLRFLMNSCYMFHLTLNTLSEMKNDEEITAFWIYEKYTQKQWEKTANHLSQNLKHKFFKFIENSGIKLARILHQNNTTKMTLNQNGDPDHKCKTTREFFVRHNHDCYLPCHENPILSIIIRGLELIVEIWDNIPKEKIRMGFPHDMMKNYFLAKGILKDMTNNQYEGEEESKTYLDKSMMESCQNVILPKLDRRESVNIERYFEEPGNEVDQPILEQKLITEDEVLIRFLADIVPNHPDFKKYLLSLINKSREDDAKESRKIASSNAITILVAANVSFASCNFKKVKICGANVRDGNFNSCDFTEADLSYTNLENCQFNKAKMMNTNLQGIKLGIYPDIDLNVDKTLRCCCFSPNGKLIAVSTMDGEIMIWEKESGVKLYILKKNDLPINSIVFSNEGTQILVGGNDTNVRIWRLLSDGGEIVKTFYGHTDCVKTVTFSSQGFFVASGSVDRTIRIWDRSSGKMIQRININSIVNSVAFSPNMKFLASGSSDHGIYIFGYKEKTWTHCRTIFGHNESITKVVFAPDSLSIFSSSYDTFIKQWDCDHGEALKTFDSNSGPVFSITISISKDGSHMLSVANDKIHLWDTKKGKILKTFIGHDWNIKSVFFSPDGESILSCTENKIKIWDKSEFLHFKLHEGHKGSILSVSFSPDGVALASGGVDHSVKLWNKTTGKLLKKFIGHKEQINFVKVSNNVNKWYIASGSYDKTIKIWDIKSEKCLTSMENHTGSVNCLDFSPDDSLIVSGSLDKTVKLWKFDGTLLKSFDTQSEVKSVCFSADGDMIFSGLFDSKIKIFHKDSLNLEVNTLIGHTNFVNSIACSTQPGIIVSGSSDRTVIVWNYKDGSKLTRFTHDNAIVNSVAFSSKKNCILSGTSDGNIYLWDIATELKLVTYEAHNGNVNAVVFGNDGRCFASCSKEIKIWEESDCFVFEKLESNESEKFRKNKSVNDFPMDLYEMSKSCQEHGKKGQSKLFMSYQNSSSLDENYFICHLIINNDETPLSCKELTFIDQKNLDSKNDQVLIQRGALGIVKKLNQNKINIFI